MRVQVSRWDADQQELGSMDLDDQDLPAQVSHWLADPEILSIRVAYRDGTEVRYVLPIT